MFNERAIGCQSLNRYPRAIHSAMPIARENVMPYFANISYKLTISHRKSVDVYVTHTKLIQIISVVARNSIIDNSINASLR